MEQGSARSRWRVVPRAGARTTRLDGHWERGSPTACAWSVYAQSGCPVSSRPRTRCAPAGSTASSGGRFDVLVAALVLLLASPCAAPDRPGDRHRVARPGLLPRGADRPRRPPPADAQVPQDVAGRGGHPAHGGRRPPAHAGRRMLAATRLDEIPQLWHVLRGDMSLVGPRPEDPGFVAAHATAYEQILSVRPGTDRVRAARVRRGAADPLGRGPRRRLSRAHPAGEVPPRPALRPRAIAVDERPGPRVDRAGRLSCAVRSP